MLKIVFLSMFSLFVFQQTIAQQVQPKDSTATQGLVVHLNKEGTANVRFITLLQTWARYTDYNSGTIYKEKGRDSNYDIALRRAVFTVVAQLNPRVLLLLNLTGSGNSGEGAFQSAINFSVLDAYGEYKFSKALYIGTGLHQWTGFSRLNADAVGSLINLDQPTFQQISWNRNDRLGRFLCIYAKGELGKLNYRVSVNEAFVSPVFNFVANTGRGSPNGGTINTEARNAQLNVAYFNPTAVSKIVQGYAEYAFWETENHITPYEVSTYQGSKKLLNVGAGFYYRNNGMLTPTVIELRDPALPESSANPKLLKSANETDIKAFAIDATLLYPFSKNLDGMAVYIGYFHTDLGPNYYSLTNIVNVTTATANASSINGSGNAYPAAGTGNTFYVQAGYIAPKQLLKGSRLGVFTTYQHSKLEALKDAVQVYEGGLNWFINGNKVRLTVMYRDRPVYKGDAAFGNQASEAVVDRRKSEVITQLQFNF
jgi:hypothetical protein